jgi:release factor glutamine methyltransferase
MNSDSVTRVLARSSLVPVDAKVLLAHVLGRDRAWLAAHGDETLTAEQAAMFAALVDRRHKGEPVAYLTGVREFWGLRLSVSRAVLIPRPETEAVVEQALLRLPKDRDARVLDLGTGSGAIAIAIARERPRSKVLATDVFAETLAVARDNARRLEVGNVDFVLSDWYLGIPSEWRDARFDLIASNPPYVAAGDPHLGDGDVRFEPVAALTAGSDGLDAIRRVVTGARGYLAQSGTLVVEHGYDQSERTCALFAAAGFGDIVTARDLAGIPRVVTGRRVDSPRDSDR